MFGWHLVMILPCIEKMSFSVRTPHSSLNTPASTIPSCSICSSLVTSEDLLSPLISMVYEWQSSFLSCFHKLFQYYIKSYLKKSSRLIISSCEVQKDFFSHLSNRRMEAPKHTCLLQTKLYQTTFFFNSQNFKWNATCSKMRWIMILLSDVFSDFLQVVFFVVFG